MIGIAQFKKNPHSLFKNNLWRIGLFTLINAVLFWTQQVELKSLLIYSLPILLLSTSSTVPTLSGLALGMGIYWFQQGVSSLDFVYIAAALIFTFPISGLYHCCSHMSLRPVWLNRFFGEITGLWHTSSLDEWSVIHAYHHRYADDIENDPHPPNGLPFFKYSSEMGKNIGRIFFKHYMQEHGQGPESVKNLKALSRSIFVRQVILTTFWFLAIGPHAFAFAFATNVVFKKWHWAWFNWVTHIKSGNKFTILNHDSGFYKIINFISFNLYYHGNHHLRPGLFNPKSMPSKNSAQETAA